MHSGDGAEELDEQLRIMMFDLGQNKRRAYPATQESIRFSGKSMHQRKIVLRTTGVACGGPYESFSRNRADSQARCTRSQPMMTGPFDSNYSSQMYCKFHTCIDASGS